MKYTIEFYEKADGNSEIWNFLEKLRKKAATNKDARIQYRQIVLHIQLLEKKRNLSAQKYNETYHR